MSLGQRPTPKRHQAKILAERRGRGQALLDWMEQRAIGRGDAKRNKPQAKRVDGGPLIEVLVEARPSTRSWRRQLRRDVARAERTQRREDARQRRAAGEATR